MQFTAIKTKATCVEIKILTEDYFDKITKITDECANEHQESEKIPETII